MIGRNRIVVILVVCALALAVAGVAVSTMPGEQPKLGTGGPLTGKGHLDTPGFASEHHGTCPQSDLPEQLQGKGIKCVYGSPINRKVGEGRLQGFFRHDDHLFVYDHHPYRPPAVRSIGFGCNGHTVKVTDTNGRGPDGETYTCNMRGHMLARKKDTGLGRQWVRYKVYSEHVDGGGGGGGGGGGAG